MKIIVLALCISSVLSFDVISDPAARQRLSGKKLVDYVNSVQTLYISEDNDMSEMEMKSKVMGLEFAPENISDYRSLEIKTEVNPVIPDSFDSRNRWSACKTVKIIRDQSHCGSGWAFSVVEVISDRICIKTNGRSQPEISVEDVITCVKCGCSGGNGCMGGNLLGVFNYWNKGGIVTGGDYGQGGCKPYSVAPCTQEPCKVPIPPPCTSSCTPGYPVPFLNDKHYGSMAYSIASVSAIQTEIMNNGPVVATFRVYSDFYKYKTGIYTNTAGSQLGVQSVKILGWGVENGVPFWTVANSWGRGWGEAGFFRILRGVNECGIEGSVVAGISNQS